MANMLLIWKYVPDAREMINFSFHENSIFHQLQKKERLQMEVSHVLCIAKLSMLQSIPIVE